MRYVLIIFIVLFLVQTSEVMGQNESAPGCAQPFSILFDEFAVKDFGDTSARLSAFLERLKKENLDQASADIHVYAGRKSKINEAGAIISQIEDFLKKQEGSDKLKIRTYDGGYRAETTVALYIRPLHCSTYPSINSTYSVDEIELEEGPPDSTVIKTADELISSVEKRTEPACPPAARAVRACGGEVTARVLIDESGKVIFAKAVSGHPLLRAAAIAAIRSWTFHPIKKKGKSFKALGNLTVTVPAPKEDLDH